LTALQAQIDGMLSADEFQPQTALPLATREQYADSVGILLRLCGREHSTQIVPVLLDIFSPRVTAFRIGSAFGAIRRDDFEGRAFTLATLRSLAARNENAAAALAALGEPVRPWTDASSRERAALILGYVVRARRDGVAP
jgi:hypothetical protein